MLAYVNELTSDDMEFIRANGIKDCLVDAVLTEWEHCQQDGRDFDNFKEALEFLMRGTKR
jgi:hypothetical protein